METTLRPRDIQARIRAGATPESVAEAAGSSVEKVMTYAAPVLAEREHVAQRALRASLRRHSGEQHTLGRTLGEAVNVRLRGMNVDPDSVLWDAWRREDGRWTLTAAFQAGGYDGLAELCFDQRGNFVTIDNDQARWLIGDAVAAPTDPADEVAPDGPRLSAVPAPAELGADAIDLVSEPESVQAPDSPAAQDTPARPDLEATMDQPLIDESLLDLPPLGPPAEAPQAPQKPEADAEEQEGVPEPAPTPARKKRMSVPSWDEILFGGSDQPS